MAKEKIKEAASRYVVSYVHMLSVRTLANYVFRKKGLMLCIYAEHIERLTGVPEEYGSQSSTM